MQPRPSLIESTEADDEPHLWRAFRRTRDGATRERLFKAHQSFARAIALRQFRARAGSDLDPGDLCQLAYAGLLEAIDRYDPERRAPFRAYAARRIAGSIADGVAQASEVREQIAFRRRIRTERARSLAPADPDGLTTADALDALAELALGLAVGFMLEDHGAGTAEDVAHASNAYDSLAWKDTVARLHGELGALLPREQTILCQHYLGGMDFERLGQLLGLSKGRISQLHRGALEALRKRLRRADFHLER